MRQRRHVVGQDMNEQADAKYLQQMNGKAQAWGSMKEMTAVELHVQRQERQGDQRLQQER